MENKEMKNPILNELDDNALDNVHGGTSEIPTMYPDVLMARHDTPGEDDTIPVGAITEA